MSRPITIVEVGPRDGLQNEKAVLEPTVRADLVRRLEAAGAVYYRFNAPEGRERARLVASWSTTEADVDGFLDAF